MTNEQKDWLLQIGKTIKKVIPDFHGYIQFNLNPNKEMVNVKAKETVEGDIEVEQNLLLYDKPKQ